MEITWSVFQEGNEYTVSGKIFQMKTPYYKIPIEICIQTENGETTHFVNVAGKTTEYSITVSSTPIAVILDPHKKILHRGAIDKHRALFAEAHDLIFSRTYQDSAAILLQKLLIKYPDDFIARAWLAFFYYEYLNNENKAQDPLTYIVQNADPGGEAEVYYTRSCFLLGNLYDKKGQRDKAVEYYNKVLKFDRTKRFFEIAKQYLKTPYTAK